MYGISYDPFFCLFERDPRFPVESARPKEGNLNRMQAGAVFHLVSRHFVFR